MSKLTTEELVFFCYESIRRDFEIMVYLMKGAYGHNTFVNKHELLFHWRFLTYKDMFININNMITITKERGTGKETYGGLIIQAVNESKLKPHSKEKLLRKTKLQKETILYIKKVRDTYYAHLDSKHVNSTAKSIAAHDYEKLIFAIHSLIQKLYGTKKLQAVLNKIPDRKEYDLIEKLSAIPK